jgi:hypothetical protein
MARSDRPSPPPSDPYEHGFEAVQRQRMPLPDLSPDGTGLKPPPRASWKWVLGGLAIVAAVGIGRGVAVTNGSALKANCHRPQISLAEKTVTSKGSGLLHWSVTAAPGTRFVVAINAASVVASGGTVAATAKTSGATQVSRTQTMSGGCLAHGMFGVLVAPGTYPVTMFGISGSDPGPLASTTVRVTAS